MTHRIATSILASLATAVRTARSRLRAAPQRGQGTVEYVALMLLVAGVLAGAVAIAGKNSTFKLGDTVSSQITKAVTKAGGEAGK